MYQGEIFKVELDADNYLICKVASTVRYEFFVNEVVGKLANKVFRLPRGQVYNVLSYYDKIERSHKRFNLQHQRKNLSNAAFVRFDKKKFKKKRHEKPEKHIWGKVNDSIPTHVRVQMIVNDVPMSVIVVENWNDFCEQQYRLDSYIKVDGRTIVQYKCGAFPHIGQAIKKFVRLS